MKVAKTHRCITAWQTQFIGMRQLDPDVLTPVIEGRWLAGYDFPALLSRIRCPAAMGQSDRETIRWGESGCLIVSPSHCLIVSD